jgi:hypothetical protein
MTAASRPHLAHADAAIDACSSPCMHAAQFSDDHSGVMMATQLAQNVF